MLLRTILIAGLFIAGAGLAWRIFPGRSRLAINRQGMHFPLVSGYNLDREEFEFPRDFGGDLNLVIIPFQQYQQTIVNTWIPFAQQTEGDTPGFIYYELPTIYNLPAFARGFINEGMRAGIPDQTARERTITLYIDKDPFKAALGIEDEDDIHLFLVDRQGEILWRTSGAYAESKADELRRVLESDRQ